MHHPDEAVSVSFAYDSDIHDDPEKVIAVVVTDEENEPAGVLEKWSADGWIYADADSVEVGEPEYAE